KQALQIAYGLREAPASIKAIAIRQSLAVSLREKGEYAKASEIAKMVSKELTEAAQTLNLAKTDLGIREESAIMNSIEQSRIESIGEKLGKIKDGDIKEAVKKEIRRKTEKATKEVVENQSKKTEKVMSEIDSLVDNIICK
ncbi:MAG: hypothetical protein PHD17_12495, partial [Methanothrix soehngenii]|nr:hypothetical protein [Methanothrix soehngenii]